MIWTTRKKININSSHSKKINLKSVKIKIEKKIFSHFKTPFCCIKMNSIKKMEGKKVFLYQ